MCLDSSQSVVVVVITTIISKKKTIKIVTFKKVYFCQSLKGQIPSKISSIRLLYYVV